MFCSSSIEGTNAGTSIHARICMGACMHECMYLMLHSFGLVKMCLRHHYSHVNICDHECVW